jgi:hypothetical protein
LRLLIDSLYDGFVLASANLLDLHQPFYVATAPDPTPNGHSHLSRWIKEQRKVFASPDCLHQIEGLFNSGEVSHEKLRAFLRTVQTVSL